MSAQPIARADVQRALRLLTACAATPDGFAILERAGVPAVVMGAVQLLNLELDDQPRAA